MKNIPDKAAPVDLRSWGIWTILLLLILAASAGPIWSAVWNQPAVRPKAVNATLMALGHASELSIFLCFPIALVCAFMGSWIRGAHKVFLGNYEADLQRSAMGAAALTFFVLYGCIFHYTSESAFTSSSFLNAVNSPATYALPIFIPGSFPLILARRMAEVKSSGKTKSSLLSLKGALIFGAVSVAWFFYALSHMKGCC